MSVNDYTDADKARVAAIWPQTTTVNGSTIIKFEDGTMIQTKKLAVQSKIPSHYGAIFIQALHLDFDEPFIDVPASTITSIYRENGAMWGQVAGSQKHKMVIWLLDSIKVSVPVNVDISYMAVGRWKA